MTASARGKALALLLGGALTSAPCGAATLGAGASAFALGVQEAGQIHPAAGTGAAPVVEIVGTSTDVLALGTGDYSAEILDEARGGVSVWLVLSQARSEDFSVMTGNYPGQSLEIYLCGELAYSAWANERIDSGVLALAQGRTKAQAEEILGRLRSGDCAGFDPQTLE